MPARILSGVVVSDKPDKTVVVKVERRFMHALYKKYIKRSKKYAAHDEGNRFKEGDRVQIRECRPLSKTKCWEVVSDTQTGADEDSAARQESADQTAGAGAA